MHSQRSLEDFPFLLKRNEFLPVCIDDACPVWYFAALPPPFSIRLWGVNVKHPSDCTDASPCEWVSKRAPAARPSFNIVRRLSFMVRAQVVELVPNPSHTVYLDGRMVNLPCLTYRSAGPLCGLRLLCYANMKILKDQLTERQGLFCEMYIGPGRHLEWQRAHNPGFDFCGCFAR